MNWRSISKVTGLFLLTLQPMVFGQRLSVETALDTNRITLGDQIHLSYIIEKKKDLKVNLPVIANPLTEGVEIIGEPEIDSTEIDNDTWSLRYQLLITSFDTGIYYIPPQAILFTDHQLEDTLFTRATYLEVQGVAIDTTYTVRDIKAIAKMPLSIGEVLMYLIPLLLLGALAYFYWVYIRPRRKRGEDIIPVKPEEPAYITALRELDKIKAQKLWQQKQVKEYYTRITHVIRWYIDRRFSLTALEMTSDEILEHIRSQKLDDVNYINLESLLNLADLVKFAKGEPDPEENLTHLDNAYDFIKQTRANQNDSSGNETEADV